MLDLTIYLHTEVRGESVANLKALFKNHVSVPSSVPSNTRKEKYITSSSSIDMDLVVADKGLEGLVSALTKQRNVKAASKVLSQGNLTMFNAASIDPLSAEESEQSIGVELEVEVVSAMQLTVRKCLL